MICSAQPIRRISSRIYAWVATVAAVGMMFTQLAYAQDTDEQGAQLKPPIVNIQAEARTEVAQDTVQFVLFVQKEGKEQVEVTKEVNEVLAQALEQAKQAAEDKDIDISTGRSEERRVGKECRSRWSPEKAINKGTKAVKREGVESKMRAEITIS